MKIGIDARFWGLEHAGLGRYVMELINSLTKLDKKNSYTLFVRKKYIGQIQLPNNFSLVVAEISHYSLEEQWLLTEIFSKEKIDLLHIPHFNVPMLYKHPFVVTIHDLLWHDVKGLSVTTQNPLIYLTKYLGYRMVVNHALRSSKAILVPSKTIKNKLIEDHKINKDKITVTYEAPGRTLKIDRKESGLLARYKLKKPYIIYVGSAYPHKNIFKVVEAIKELNEKRKINFAIVSARSAFLNQLNRKIIQTEAQEMVKLLGYVADGKLAFLISEAEALVQPSLSEGFGLTGLEAMAIGTPVIASESQIFKEIYENAAIFINPHSSEDIAKKINSVLSDKSLQEKQIKKGKERVKKFNWEDLAYKTLKVYQKANQG